MGIHHSALYGLYVNTYSKGNKHGNRNKRKNIFTCFFNGFLCIAENLLSTLFYFPEFYEIILNILKTKQYLDSYPAHLENEFDKKNI